MVEKLTNCFVYGCGIQQYECFLELATKDGKISYKIWFDVDFECQLKSQYKDKGLNDYDISLLILNRIMDLRVSSISTDEDNNLKLVIDSGIELVIKGSVPGSSEPWRIWKTSPPEELIATA